LNVETARTMQDLNKIPNRRYLYLMFAAWLIATVATAGSLFMSEVMERTPCVLCWYQRIAMFPLVVILAAGMLPPDTNCTRYALPLAVTGGLIALYHCIIYLGVIPESLQPCTQGISCKDADIHLVGFVTIPQLSLLAFILLTALLLAARKVEKK
jgi:disulfide bond formation protein DsbB